MADITMCEGLGCPLKDTCYRHTAPTGTLQSYFLTSPYDTDADDCDFYWPVRADDE